MSDEETRADAPDPAADGSTAGSTPPQAGAEEGAGGMASPSMDPAPGEVVVREASPPVSPTAEGLGDTLPSVMHDQATETAAQGSGAAHAAHGHGGHDDHFAHTMPMKMLIGVLGALIILTVLTVAVTSIDLGSQGNFIVAMIIATIKAGLVMGYFMHLVWDSKFNALTFLSSFLFVLLFLSMSLLDRSEYQPGIDQFEADQKASGQ